MLYYHYRTQAVNSKFSVLAGERQSGHCRNKSLNHLCGSGWVR